MEFDKSIIRVGTADTNDPTGNGGTTFVTTDDVEKEMSSSAKGLLFLEVPDGDDMRIQTIKIEDENFIFSSFSMLISYLQPQEFPLGQ